MSLKFVEKVLWSQGVVCGYCQSKRVSKKNKKTGFFQCKDCRKKFNVKTGTIFHRSKLPLNKWLYAIYLTQTGRKGISSLELSKKLGITQKSAWFMWHRIREACKDQGRLLSGVVSSDESYFGAKAKYKKEKPGKQGLTDKIMVQGIKAGNQMKFFIINSPNKKALQGNIAKSVEAGSVVVTDELMSYRGLDSHYEHAIVKHSSNNYVCPETGLSTNDIESVWALMKRGHKGVYHQWSKKHMHRYFEEFAFRLNQGNCAIDTIDRVKALVKGSVDKRLTYKKLIK